MPVTAFGMVLLSAGLAVAVGFETTGIDVAEPYVEAVGSMPPAYVTANAFWTLGALVLIFPPAMAGFEMLVVLEIFLAVSGVMSYWQPESFAIKILSRVGMSLAAVGYLKARGMIEGVKIPWSLLSPAFYVNAWREGDNRALAVGLELLGVGYALSSMVLLTIGSAYLVRSSWVSWGQTKQPIFAAWTGLNTAYVAAGVVILLAQITQACT